MSNPMPLSKSEFIKQADSMAREIILAIGEKPLDAFIVLEALLRVHRFTCMQLTPDGVGAASMALAAYAGDLLQASATGKGLVPPTKVH